MRNFESFDYNSCSITLHLHIINIHPCIHAWLPHGDTLDFNIAYSPRLTKTHSFLKTNAPLLLDFNRIPHKHTHTEGWVLTVLHMDQCRSKSIVIGSWFLSVSPNQAICSPLQSKQTEMDLQCWAHQLLLTWHWPMRGTHLNYFLILACFSSGILRPEV